MEAVERCSRIIEFLSGKQQIYSNPTRNTEITAIYRAAILNSQLPKECLNINSTSNKL